MIVRFHMPCIPPTTSHHHKKVARVAGFARLVDRDELVAAKGLLEELLIPHQLPHPVEGPVALTVEYTWPWLSSHGKRIRTHGRIPHISKPDLTNVTKTIEDRLVRLRFIEDDRKVADLHVRKWWGERPGIEIAIAPFTAAAFSTLTPSAGEADLFAQLEEGTHAAHVE